MLYFIDRSNILHGMSRIQGGGEDTLARVSYPPLHPVLCSGALKKQLAVSDETDLQFLNKTALFFQSK